ncbi:uncharacterized protein LOC141697861 isoform X3 [Apium graveolens]|uniref:uncharacterized protein LOC141697861 isoform X3 n=1 Tax=Apium graveolens TaxID=4045 RepID=UPI003D7B01CE
MTMRETLAFVCKSRGGGSNYAELARRLEERKMQISNLLLSRHLYERTETETSKGNIEVSSNSLPPKDVEELMSSLKMDKLLIEEIRIRKGGYQFFFRFKDTLHVY